MARRDPVVRHSVGVLVVCVWAVLSARLASAAPPAAAAPAGRAPANAPAAPGGAKGVNVDVLKLLVEEAD